MEALQTNIVDCYSLAERTGYPVLRPPKRCVRTDTARLQLNSATSLKQNLVYIKTIIFSIMSGKNGLLKLFNPYTLLSVKADPK